MERPRLLIVEDEEAIRNQKKWALADDYSVLLAGDRKSALEQVRTHRPPLVLLADLHVLFGDAGRVAALVPHRGHGYLDRHPGSRALRHPAKRRKQSGHYPNHKESPGSITAHRFFLLRAWMLQPTREDERGP